jgi:DNA primase
VIGSDLAALVKQAVEIVEVVGQVVPLRRAGSRHVGLCPFHREKTPSFYVDSNNQMYHCFGCGSGGDVLSFVMKHQNLSFVDAIQYLADRYHINLPQRDSFRPESARLSEASKSEQDQLYTLMESATDYFARQLKLSEIGKAARDYVRKRALPPDLVETERLGYALPQWDGLLSHLRSCRIDPGLGVKAGLLATSSRDQGRFYDRFRNRLMFPITDERKRVVAFGGRILSGGTQDEPKYLNSPESPVFHKGRMLYQIARAGEACRQVRQVVLVEGYMDLLAFHAHGFYRVVATLGTALTQHQVRLLSRRVDEVVLAYDGDDAGERAMLRALPLLLQEELAASCIRFPEQMDPDDFLRVKGLAAFEKLVQRREDLGVYAIRKVLQGWDGTITGKAKILAELQPIYRSVRQPVLESEYLRLIADRLAISETDIQRHFRHEAHRPPGRSQTAVPPPAPMRLAQTHSLEENILRMMIQHPEMVEDVKESGAIECFQETGLRSIAEVVIRGFSTADGPFRPGAVYEQLPDSELKDCFTKLLLDPYDLKDARLQLQDWLDALRRRGHKRRRLDLREALRQAEQSGDQVQIRKLLSEIQGLNLSPDGTTQARDNV